MFNLHHGDCVTYMKSIPDNSIDCVITDCPYHIVAGGCSTNANEPKGMLRRRLRDCEAMNKAAQQGKVFEYNEIKFEEWLPEVYRILKEDTHCYIMINSRNLKELQEKAESVGFIFQNLLVWKKNNATPSQFYMNQCEYVLLLRKGRARYINNLGTMNFFEVPNIIGDKLHPTEKPVNLMKIFVQNSTNEGDLVMDPFMGSGSTGCACKELNRNFIGCEIDDKYFEIAESRINGTAIKTSENYIQGELF